MVAISKHGLRAWVGLGQARKYGIINIYVNVILRSFNLFIYFSSGKWLGLFSPSAMAFKLKIGKRFVSWLV